MPRDSPGSSELDAGEAGAASGGDGAATDSSVSSSAAFLRDLAHVSDQPLSAFHVDLGLDGEVGPVSGRFAVRRRVGAGGFGTVYEALDHERNATVAIKVLRRRDGRSIARFKGEFRSLSEVVHPNLVQLYELHAAGDEWLFSMEFVRGEDLLSYVRPSGGRFDEARLRAAFGQLAEGLSFLHGTGKLHRDVKPSNVMVTTAGRVVIVDFGLASDVDSRTAEEGIFGTPAFMAPEQAEGRTLGTAADWYAVGVMLYQALTGALPARDATALETRSTSRRSDPSAPVDEQRWISPLPPSALVAGVPEDLDRLCVELLDRAPEQRPRGREVRRRLSGGDVDGVADGGAEPNEQAAGADVPFVGRAAHLEALHDALAKADEGAAVTVFVHGRSGMGKSAVLQRFLVEVRARDPSRLVLFGRCFEQESVPYKGVDGLVDELCRRLRARPIAEVAAMVPTDLPMLTRLFPSLAGLGGARSPISTEGVDDPALRQRAFAALGELIAGVAHGAPVLVVDDLQWGDLDGVTLLSALLHRRVLIVASYRGEDAESNPVLRSFFGALEALSERVEVRRVEVAALDDREAEALSRSLLRADGRAPPAIEEERVRALVVEARGDPFLLSELTRHRTEVRRSRSSPDRPIDAAPAGASDGDDATTGNSALHLAGLLAARIGRLPVSARRLLAVLALEGQPIARAIAARAAYGGEGDSEALAAIGLLRARCLVRTRRTDEGEEILPYHDRVRETVTEGLDPATTREHHHLLALAFEASASAEPERLLFHFQSAGRLVDAARYAAEAARRAHEALAFDRAARLYRSALALTDLPPGSDAGSRARSVDEDRRLRVALAEALAGAGRPREAALAYLEAADGADATRKLAWSRRAAEHLVGAGYADEGLDTLRGVLRDVGVKLSTSPARSLWGFATLRLRLGVRGLGYRERPEGAVAATDLLRVDACYAAALGLFLGNPILALESQARHLLVALEAGEPFRVARALAFEAIFNAVRRGPGASTDRLLDAARAIEQRMGQPYLTGWLRLCEGQIAQIAGRWKLSHDLVRESESVLRRHCTGVSLEIDLALFRRMDTLWILGEIAELSRVGPVLVDEARERGNRYLETMVRLSIGATIGLIEGRPDRARDAVATALSRWPRVAGSMMHVREIRAEARTALYEGRGDRTLAIVDEGLAALRRTGLVRVRVQLVELHTLRALAALSVGDLAGAARYARPLTSLTLPWLQSAASLVEAGIARRAGDHDRALTLLGRARDKSREREEALYEHAISRRIGEWVGGDDGRSQVRAANAWMMGQGIADPERMTAMLLGWA